MKRMFKFFASAAIVAAVLTGCTSETDGPVVKETVDPNGVVEGIPTYATFKFSISEGDTKAAVGDNGEGSTSSTTIKDIRLLIYNAKDSCEANILVNDAGHLTGAGSVSNAPKSATVQVTSGIKRIYVIANASQIANINGPLNAIAPKTATALLSNFNKVFDLVGAGGSNTYPASAVPANLTALGEMLTNTFLTNNGYLMSNAIDANAVKQLVANIDSMSSADGTPAATASATNTIAITIQRAVAKARTTYAAAATLNTTDGVGLLADIKYTYLNVNRAIYPFQVLGQAVDPTPGAPSPLANYPQSPYFENAAYTANSNEANWKNYYYNYGTGDLVAMIDKVSGAAASTTYPAYYLTENTQQTNHAKGNTSSIGVEGRFQPKGNFYIQGPYEGTAAPYNDSIKLTAGVFTVPGTRKSTATLSTLPTEAGGRLYQVRGGRNGSIITGIPDSMFFTNRLTAYKVAFLINCVNASLTSQLNAFNIANPTAVPAGFTLADSLSYDATDNFNANVALVAEFVDAKCYYGIRFADPSATPKTGVKRNHYYQFNITEFKSIGQESLTDVNKPPTESVEDGETYITATLTIDPWRNVVTDVIAE
jgi:hypothetical protein